MSNVINFQFFTNREIELILFLEDNKLKFSLKINKILNYNIGLI